MYTKQEIRIQIQAAKAACPEDIRRSKSMEIFSMVEGSSVFKKSKIILAYWSLPDEVCSHEAVIRWAGSKTVLLPVVNGTVIEVVCFTGTEYMVPTRPWGIREPIGEAFTPLNQIDLVIVPGIAFDVLNHRLGRGKGYYDQLLSGLTAYKIGVGFDFQLLPTVPAEAHDIPMDQIIVA